jgi:MGT family glycosyltransferase
MVPLAAALCARGHRVHWCTGARFAHAVEATGARFEAMHSARDWEHGELARTLRELGGRRGLGQVKAQLQAMFIRPATIQLGELAALCDALDPDALLSDSSLLAAAWLSERRGLPWISLGVGPLMQPSADTAPFGSALAPGRTKYHRARNALLNWVVQRVIFADVNRGYRRGRVAAELPAGRATYFDAMSPDLHLQPTIEAFEYPRRRLPPQVRFIGPLVHGQPAPPRDALPGWWPDVEAACARGTPIVVVTQGTLATDPHELIAPALRALAGEPVMVVATTPADPATLGLRELPPNARIARWVDYELILPRASAFVTNGGYHGVQMALWHGVPLVVASGSEEKPETAARVAWAGNGVDLRSGQPTPHALRKAVRRVLGDAHIQRRARELSELAAGCDAPRTAADLIEAVIAQRRAPVALERAGS